MSNDPVRVALEYINTRNSYIERYRGAGGTLLGNAARVTQLQFIEMCNQMAVRFASEMPDTWHIREWETFSRFDLDHMSDNLATGQTLTLTEWEACSELAKTYLALLRMRETP